VLLACRDVGHETSACVLRVSDGTGTFVVCTGQIKDMDTMSIVHIPPYLQPVIPCVLLVLIAILNTVKPASVRTVNFQHIEHVKFVF